MGFFVLLLAVIDGIILFNVAKMRRAYPFASRNALVAIVAMSFLLTVTAAMVQPSNSIISTPFVFVCSFLAVIPFVHFILNQCLKKKDSAVFSVAIAVAAIIGAALIWCEFSIPLREFHPIYVSSNQESTRRMAIF